MPSQIPRVIPLKLRTTNSKSSGTFPCHRLGGSGGGEAVVGVIHLDGVEPQGVCVVLEDVALAQVRGVDRAEPVRKLVAGGAYSVLVQLTRPVGTHDLKHGHFMSPCFGTKS